MPHVKGNKFKPKEGGPPPPQLADARGQQSKKKRRAAAAAAAAAVPGEPAVVEAAAATAAAAAEDGAPPAAKKQRRKQQQQQRHEQQAQQLPAIKTIVAPPPKPGAPPANAAAAGAASSNWAALRSAMQQQQEQAAAGRKPWHKKRKAVGELGTAPPAAAVGQPQSIGADTAPTKVLAIDCEMVGVGPGGQTSVLARVCVLNSAGNVLLDRFVRPQQRVTDFRTRVSGVRPADLRSAAPFPEVQRQVAALLAGRILVGHALDNDLEVLQLSHPRRDVRDTAGGYPPLMQAQARTGRLKPRALRHLAEEQLGLAIQRGEHSPVDDARAALYLYLKHRKEWERWLAAGGGRQGRGGSTAGAGRPQPSLEELACNDIMSDL